VSGWPQPSVPDCPVHSADGAAQDQKTLPLPTAFFLPLKELQQQGIAAGIYTQTTDVEGEINGLMTYDRKVIKIPAEELAELHEPLLDPAE